jgi:hypothetical protein
MVLQSLELRHRREKKWRCPTKQVREEMTFILAERVDEVLRSALPARSLAAA